MITAEYVRQILSYDPHTGIFAWKEKTCRKVVVGTQAGGLNVAGYVVIGIGGRTYYAHQLAWLYMTGEFVRRIDHRDTVKYNNRWTNLRIASPQQNGLNAKRHAHNTSGFKGVSWHRASGKWSAYIILDNRKRHLGLHETPEAAHAAYLRAAVRAQPEFARAA